VVVLAGGTGGAKLARGMQDVVGAERLAVIANTGDDIEIYGAHVSPDPDLVSFWLADAIDERGWGLRGDTFKVMDALRELGVDVWFNLGDRDLAWCLERRRMLDEGATATAALARLNAALGVRAAVLPASEDPVRTWVRTEAGWHSFQDYMIRAGAGGLVGGLEFRGAEQAVPSPEALAAIAGARAIVIGPSNPLASCAGRGRQPDRRRRGAEGSHGRLHGLRGARMQRARRGRLLRRAARRSRLRRAPVAGRPADASDRHAHVRRARARERGRASAGLRRLAGGLGSIEPCAPPRSCQ
jgi:hypothetical protein